MFGTLSRRSMYLRELGDLSIPSVGIVTQRDPSLVIIQYTDVLVASFWQKSLQLFLCAGKRVASMFFFVASYIIVNLISPLHSHCRRITMHASTVLTSFT